MRPFMPIISEPIVAEPTVLFLSPASLQQTTISREIQQSAFCIERIGTFAQDSANSKIGTPELLSAPQIGQASIRIVLNFAVYGILMTLIQAWQKRLSPTEPTVFLGWIAPESLPLYCST